MFELDLFNPVPGVSDFASSLEAVDAEATFESELLEQSLSSLYFLVRRMAEAETLLSVVIFSVLMGLLLLVSSFFLVERSKTGESSTGWLKPLSTFPGRPETEVE